MISEPIKDYVYGLYGRPVAPLDQKIAELILEGYERGQVPISQRPGDLIEPELEQAIDAIKNISTDMDDVLTYSLYPTTGMKFLRIKHGLDPIPDEMKPETLQESTRTTPSHKPHTSFRRSGPKARTFNVYIEEEVYQVEVDPVSSINAPLNTTSADAQTRPSSNVRPDSTTRSPVTSTSPGETTLLAPIPGLVSRYTVEIGQRVEAGDTVVVLEAMKMENSLPSPATGSIKTLPIEPGTAVAKGDILAVIAS